MRIAPQSRKPPTNPSGLSAQLQTLRGIRPSTPIEDEDEGEDDHDSWPNPDESPAPARLAVSTVAHRPTIVNREATHRSREGLLDIFDPEEEEEEEEDDDDDSGSQGSGSDGDNLTADIQQVAQVRSANVGYGTTAHVRHVSAGSARLLELPSRGSAEMKRYSSASGGSIEAGRVLEVSAGTDEGQTKGPRR